uniref:N-terminal kinase-like protein n=1 Tax=Lygus hesperus TaxID=30085 RepID=A0A0A9WDH2_LYGHE
MWPFFSRDPSKDFPYDCDEESEYPVFNGFSLRRGAHKVTKEPVSIFCYHKKQGNNDQYEYAKALLKRLKTIRHPNILTFLDSQENENNLLIVTEYVKPLLYYLDTVNDLEEKQSYLTWGLMNVCKAISFLNSDAKLSHNEVAIEAVYVNSAGEWKLGRLGKATELEGSSSPSSRLAGTPTWTNDSLGFGILIWEVHNSRKCDSPTQLSNSSKVPTALRRTYQELISSQEGKRPTVSTVIERGRKVGGFFQNDLVDAIVFLDEIHIKNKEEINLFFKNIQPLLNDLPQCTAEFKILPQLMKAFEYGCDGTCVLPPLFEITNHISDRHFQNDVIPFLTKVFGSNDRATRSILLQNLERYIEKIPSNIINESFFPQIVNGFMDTNPRIREQTVKAMIHVAPKLNDRNLNTELMTHFARILAKDDQGGIRTNTIVCLTKVGYCLNPQNRRMILMSAFLRSLNDPFPPVRNAGTLGLAVSQQYFSLEDVSKRILPALCSLTLDADPAVRESVFKTIKGFLSNLEKVSDNPELKEQMEAEAMSSKKPTSSWAEWAATAITSKFSLKMDRKPEQGGNLDKPKDVQSKSNKADLPTKPVPPIQPKVDRIDPEISLIDVEKPPHSISEKMKYLGDDDSEFNWDGDSWEALEDDTSLKNPTPEIQLPKPAIIKKPSNKAEEEKRKSRTGPMKLGSRVNQPKFD